MAGFRVDKAGRTARSSNFQLRYGNGLYFSRASGKAHDYSKTEVCAFVYVCVFRVYMCVCVRNG